MTTREPLTPLPLSLFMSFNSYNLPSPLSLPMKRPAPQHSTSTSISSTASTSRSTPGESASKLRRTSAVEDGTETVKRTRVREVTPKAKAVLERDEFGIGQSPARRLFLDDGVSLGITGATPPSPGPSRSLAPSPPIVSSPSSSSTLLDGVENGSAAENGASADHDIGFTILSDTFPSSSSSSATSVASRPAPLRNPQLHTPDSKRNASLPPLPPAIDSVLHQPSSPVSISTTSTYFDDSEEDTENIPPLPSASALSLTPLSKPSRNQSTSAKSSPSQSRQQSQSLTPSTRTSTSTSSSARFLDDGDIVSLGLGHGSGRKRQRERSKLSEMITKQQDESGMGKGKKAEVAQGEEEEEEELTPGRVKAARAEGKGKERMAMEVDEA